MRLREWRTLWVLCLATVLLCLWLRPLLIPVPELSARVWLPPLPLPLSPDAEGLDYRQTHTAVVLLDIPERPFHADHWFHIAEHYLSQRQRLTSVLQTSHYTQILFVMRDPQMAQMLSRMTFFLTVLTAWHSTVTRVLLLALAEPWDEISRRHPKCVLQSSTGPLTRGCEEIIFAVRADAVWEIDLSQPLDGRFRVSSTAAAHVCANGNRFADPDENATSALPHASIRRSQSRECIVTGSFVASIGRRPVSSGQWFASATVAQSIRENAMRICQWDDSIPIAAAPLPVTDTIRILVYQRDEIRRLTNVDELWTADFRNTITQSFGKAIELVTLVHDEHRHPCDVFQQFQRADIVISSHGFQLTALLFMRSHSLLIEIFPYKYFKTSYFPLSKLLDLSHRWILSATPTSTLLQSLSLEHCMNDQICRSFARSQDVSIQDDEFNVLRALIVFESMKSRN